LNNCRSIDQGAVRCAAIPVENTTGKGLRISVFSSRGFSKGWLERREKIAFATHDSFASFSSKEKEE